MVQFSTREYIFVLLLKYAGRLLYYILKIQLIRARFGWLF